MLSLKVLSQHIEEKEDKSIKCLLCEGNLQEYIEALPEGFMKYDIQREIVSNRYLDKIIDTIIAKQHIPSIILVTDGEVESDLDRINISEFRILDGLQRSYRLKVINDTFKLVIDEINKGADLFNKGGFKLAQEYKEKLAQINSSSSIFNKIIQSLNRDYKQDISKFTDNFLEQRQWFEVWYGLTLQDEVDKMLLFNAGHRAVSNKHQLELLFLRLLPNIENITNGNVKIKIYRDKNISAMKFAKTREVGQYHFSNILSGALAYVIKKPVTINNKLVIDVQEGNNSFDNIEMINYAFISKMMEFLVQLDILISNQYQELGTLWLGRDTVIIGLFAALGNVTKQTEDPKVVFDKLVGIIKGNDSVLNLHEYEDLRGNLDLSQVNIGHKTKNAVFCAICEMLNKEEIKSIEWKQFF